jgi:hypothetical protein
MTWNWVVSNLIPPWEWRRQRHMPVLTTPFDQMSPITRMVLVNWLMNGPALVPTEGLL